MMTLAFYCSTCGHVETVAAFAGRFMLPRRCPTCNMEHGSPYAWQAVEYLGENAPRTFAPEIS